MPAFDPYHVWLGIPPHQQPPNHYRLLGIELFESDPTVINNATERQVTHVRGAAIGPHSGEAQRLLNEIARARSCLLKPERRAAYDQQLRRTLGPAGGAAAAGDVSSGSLALETPAPAGGAANADPSVTQTPGAEAAPGPRLQATAGRPGQGRQGRRKLSVPVEMLKVIVGGVLGLGVGAVVLKTVFDVDLLGLGDDSRPVVQAPLEAGGGEAPPQDSAGESPAAGADRVQPAGEAGEVAGGAADRGTDADAGGPAKGAGGGATTTRPGIADNGQPPRGGATADNSPGPSPTDTTANATPADGDAETPPARPASDSGPDTTTGSTAENSTAENSTAENSTTDASAAGGRSPAAPAGNSKPQPPDRSVQAEKLEAIRDIYEKDFRAAKTSADRAQLARQLLGEARGLEDAPDDHFSMLRQAYELALTGGDVVLARQAVDAITTAFDVNELELLAHLVLSMEKEALVTPERDRLAQVAHRAAGMLFDEQRFARARQLAGAVERLAARARNAELSRANQILLSDIEDRQSRSREAQRARKALENSPDDPGLNQTYGLYLCLDEADWSGGLALLAKARDDKLREAARADLARPTDAAAQIEVADRWRDVAEQDTALRFFLARAGFWYRLAAPETSGLDQAKVEKRLKEIADANLPERLLASLNKSAVPQPAEIITRLAAERSLPLIAAGTSVPLRSAVLAANAPVLAAINVRQSQVHVLDAKANRQLAVLPRQAAPPTALDFSPAAPVLAVGGADGAVMLWDWERNTTLRTMRPHASEVRLLRFSPDGRYLATAGGDQKLVVWDMQLARASRPTSLDGNCEALAFAPDSEQLAISTDTPSGDLVRLVPLNGGGGRAFTRPRVVALAFSPDGKYLTLGIDELNGRDRIELIALTADAGPGRVLSVLSVVDLCFSPDGDFLAVASAADGVVFVDTREFQTRGFIPDVLGARLSISGDGKMLVTNSATSRRSLLHLLEATKGAAAGGAAPPPSTDLTASAAAGGRQAGGPAASGSAAPPASETGGDTSQPAGGAAATTAGAGGSPPARAAKTEPNGAPLRLREAFQREDMPAFCHRIQFARSGELLYLGTTGRGAGGPQACQFHVLDPSGLREVRRATFEQQFSGFACDKDSDRLLLHCGDGVFQWDWRQDSNQPRLLLERPEDDFWLRIAPLPGSDDVILASHHGKISRFAPDEKVQRWTITAPSKKVAYFVACSPDGRWVATSHHSSGMYVWNAETGQQKAFAAIEPNSLFMKPVFPDADTLLAYAPQRGLRVWELESMRTKELAEPSRGGSSPYAASTMLTADGKLWLARKSNKLQVFDTEDFSRVAVAEQPVGGSADEALSPDARWIATARRTGDLKHTRLIVWEVEDPTGILGGR